MSPWCRTGRPGPQDVSHANAEGDRGCKPPKSARLQVRFKKSRGLRFKIVRVAYESSSCEGRLNGVHVHVVHIKQFLSITEKR